jgi:hypothetical protein
VLSDFTMSNIKNIDGFRRCYLCDHTFPATNEYFPKDKNRPLGLGYQCKPCAKIKSKEREKPRPLRWQEMSEEDKIKRKAVQKKHIANGGWRAMRVGAYRYYDTKKGLSCDLTTKWFRENIQNKSCVYCKRDNVRIGCDRIDNSIGHTMANVVPSCGDCNKCRQDIFTHEEMLKLGPHIAIIFLNRNWKPTY